MAKINLEEIKKNGIVIEEPNFSIIDGKYLRSFRMKMKMSQSLFADYLGVSKKAIEKWEQGKNKINPVVARMIYLMENEPRILSMLKNIKVGNFSINSNSLFNSNQIDVENDKLVNDSYKEIVINNVKHNDEWKSNNNYLINEIRLTKANDNN